MELDDILSLGAESRRMLRELGREPFRIARGRHLSWEMGVLVDRGLAFRNAGGMVSITSRGEEVLERVA